jgi:hypothetical protein
LRRGGLTLLELLIAMSILVMVAGTLASLARGIQQGYEYTEGHGLATQHARVVLERIGRCVREATANEQFPGAIVVAEQVGSWRFPDTLVVWHPEASAADPDGLPRYNELVIYCPSPSAPSQLIELTAPLDTRTVPPVDQTAQWATEIANLKQSASSQQVGLTDLVRSGSVNNVSESSWRGAVRFETRLRPSEQEWDDYQDSSRPWDELSWVQGIYGSQTGLRQTWVRMELQLMPGEAVAGDPAALRPIPFFGSAALYYELSR